MDDNERIEKQTLFEDLANDATKACIVVGMFVRDSEKCILKTCFSLADKVKELKELKKSES